MKNEKSTITLNLNVQGDDQKAPQTTEIVWPNLSYDQVLYIENAVLGALQSLNDGALEFNKIKA